MNWDRLWESFLAASILYVGILFITVVVMTISVVTLAISAWLFYGVLLTGWAVVVGLWYKNEEDDE